MNVFIYFIEPSAEETVAGVGSENSPMCKTHKELSAEHGAMSPVAHSSKGDFLSLLLLLLLLLL